MPRAFQGGGQPGKEVGAVDVVANRLAQHVAGHPHADAVGKHQVRLLQGFQILRVAAGDVHAIGIHEADLRGRIAVEPVDDRFDGLFQRDIVDLDVEQLDPRPGSGPRATVELISELRGILRIERLDLFLK